ncbi:MAG: S16 family serine protease [Bacilli bacterium]
MKNEKNNKIQNLKERIIKFFKNPREVVSFFLPIIITISLLIPVPYYIKMGGGTINLDKEISIEGEKKETGSLEALYVRESKGVVLTYLLSYIVPSFEKEKIEDTVINEEDEDSYNYREKLYFTTSLDSATKVAFEKAGKEVKISSSKFLVIYIDKSSKTNLEVGDEILKIEGEKVDSYDKMTDLVSKNKNKKQIKITVKRDNKEIDTFNELIEIDGEKKLGVVISNEIKYTSDPEVNFEFNGRQAGPSGGLMIALTIYNKLTDEDITKGKKIVGTGSIDNLGNVGEIGGIKHKLMAANSKKADIVFVPEANYKEAKKIKDEKKYNFELVSVSTFDDAIEYLNK